MVFDLSYVLFSSCSHMLFHRVFSYSVTFVISHLTFYILTYVAFIFIVVLVVGGCCRLFFVLVLE